MFLLSKTLHRLSLVQRVPDYKTELTEQTDKTTGVRAVKIFGMKQNDEICIVYKKSEKKALPVIKVKWEHSNVNSNESQTEKKKLKKNP